MFKKKKTSNKKTNKSPGIDAFIGKFYQMFREEIILTLLKLFEKNCRWKNTPKLIL